MAELGEKLKNIRLEKKLSQNHVAVKAGITQPSYVSIEKGDTKNVSLKVAKAIAKALDVDFNELFEVESKSSNNIFDLQKEIQELNDRLNKLKEDLEIQKQLSAHKDKILLFSKIAVLNSVYQFETDFILMLGPGNDNFNTKEIWQKLRDILIARLIGENFITVDELRLYHENLHKPAIMRNKRNRELRDLQK